MDNQTKRTYKKWSDEEMSKLLNFLKEEHNFEKPTTEIFYKKCIKQTGIEAEWSTLRFKVRNLKLMYMKAKSYQNQADTVSDGKDLRLIQYKIQNMCPYFNELDHIFNRIKSEPEYHVSGLLSISDNSLFSSQLTPTVNDKSQQSLPTDTPIRIKLDLSQLTVQPHQKVLQPHQKATISIINTPETTTAQQLLTTDAAIRVRSDLSQSTVQLHQKGGNSIIGAFKSSSSEQSPMTNSTAPVVRYLAQPIDHAHQNSTPKRVTMQLALIEAEKIALEREKLIADERFRQQQLELEKRKFEHEKKKSNKKLKLKKMRMEKEMDLRKYELDLKYGVVKNNL